MVKLPEKFKSQVLAYPESSFGVVSLTIRTDDGRTYYNVTIAWGEEIVKVEGYDVIPFDPGRIVWVSCP